MCLSQIPFGETRSYAWLRVKLENPKAARAVGRAVAQILSQCYSCHRVIGSDGSLTGYGGGFAIEKKTAELEGAVLL